MTPALPVIAISAAAALLAGVATAGAAPLGKALDYLSARQDRATGAVGPPAGRAADTAWTAMAVAGAREHPRAWGSGAATLAGAVAALPVEATGDALR
ncbi:MAG: hypothetical protein NWS72_01210, partial [Thermoleophilia bacterium]|nr:hypothetical protein [Thermoleophilia bacterium]